MQPLNNQFCKVLYVVLLFLYFNNKVIGQELDENLIPDLYAKYEEAVRSNDTSTDENMISLRRLFRNNKEYSVHVKKLKEVNGYKTHNLMIKGTTRSNDTIIYINNPVESKIPNAYLTLDEFKKVLTERINSKKDAYSILHKPKQYHSMSISIRSTTKSRKNKVKIEASKITYFSRTTIKVSKVKKPIVNSTTVSTTSKMTQNNTKNIDKSNIQKNLTDSKQQVSQTTLLEDIKPNQTYNIELKVENTTVASENLAKTYDTTDNTIIPFVKDVGVTQLNITEENITKTLPELSDDAVTVSSTTDSNIVTNQIEVTESEAITTEAQFDDSSDKIEKGSQNVLRSIDTIDSNKTNENIVNVTTNNLNEKVKDDNSSVTIDDNTAKSEPSETTTSEGIVNSEESTTQKTEFWRLKRGKTKPRTTTKPKTTSTRRTYGRPRVFFGR